MGVNVTRREICRLCESKRLEIVLLINASPIGDAYISAELLGKTQECYPLDLYMCSDCGHVQNIDIVNPELLFRDYVYVTSCSLGLVEHFQRYAEDVIDRFKLRPDSLVVEIGSNDGSLLKYFKQHDLRVVGVDPAVQIAQNASDAGIPTLPEYFDSNIANNIRAEHGPAKLIAANNVFAHADNLSEIVEGIKALLDEDGVFIFEGSYLVDIINNYLFDTIYHEHVSYHSITPLDRFFNKHDMQLFDIERIPTKGGSIRCFVQHSNSGQRKVSPVIGGLIESEKTMGITDSEIYHAFAKAIGDRKTALNNYLDDILAQGMTVAGYGASTTVTTLLWHFGLTRKINYLLDDNPRKIGLYSPGCHIPVMPSDEIYIKKPDYIVILAWQYSEPIIRRHQKYIDEGGKFIIPLTELKVVPE